MLGFHEKENEEKKSMYNKQKSRNLYLHCIIYIHLSLLLPDRQSSGKKIIEQMLKHQIDLHNRETALYLYWQARNPSFYIYIHSDKRKDIFNYIIASLLNRIIGTSKIIASQSRKLAKRTFTYRTLTMYINIEIIRLE